MHLQSVSAYEHPGLRPEAALLTGEGARVGRVFVSFQLGLGGGLEITQVTEDGAVLLDPVNTQSHLERSLIGTILAGQLSLRVLVELVSSQSVFRLRFILTKVATKF